MTKEYLNELDSRWIDTALEDKPLPVKPRKPKLYEFNQQGRLLTTQIIKQARTI